MSEDTLRVYEDNEALKKRIAKLEAEVESLEDLQTTTSMGAHKARVECSKLESDNEAYRKELSRLKTRSITELCADHENLLEYVKQLETQVTDLERKNKVLREALELIVEAPYGIPIGSLEKAHQALKDTA